MAIEVARRLGTEIVSCDSRQFYRELDIGVARPSAEELASVPHHFIAHRSVTNPYNAYQFEQEALARLEVLFAEHDEVVAVGGSGLYVDALCQGIVCLPDPSPELRQRLAQQIREEGLEPLREQLRALDPVYYEAVDRQNPMRLQRALETILTAGRPYSELLKQERTPRPFRIMKIGLQTEREILRNRIALRTDRMMRDGLLEEVRSVLHLRQLNTLNTVGYKELFAYMDNRCSLDDAVNNIKLDTWHYAKKQITWLKRYPEIIWTDNHDVRQAMQHMEHGLREYTEGLSFAHYKDAINFSAH